MSQETMDNIFHANGFADAVMADIRRGITFTTGHGLSFERLVNSLKADHSLEEVDNYDALLGLYHIFMTMAAPMARHQVLADLTDFGLENIQFRMVMAFEDDAREVFSYRLLGMSQSYLSIMA